jgi:NarL family two-component system sensor histidine kinase LiaS
MVDYKIQRNLLKHAKGRFWHSQTIGLGGEEISMRQPVFSLRQLQWQLSLSYILMLLMTILALFGIVFAALVFRTVPTPSDQLVQQLEVNALVLQVKELPPGTSLAQVVHAKMGSHLLSALSTLDVARVLGVLILDDAGQEISAASLPGEQVKSFAARSQSQAVIHATFARIARLSDLVYTYADGSTVAAVPLVDASNQLVGTLFVAVNGLRFTTASPPFLSVLSGALGRLPFVVALILAVGLSGTLFCIIVARQLVRRLHRIATTVHAWSHGKFHVAVNDHATDELGQLAQDLNQMAQQIQTLLDTRREFALMEERQRMARDLHDSVKQHTFAITLLIGAAQTKLFVDPKAAHHHLLKAEDLANHIRQELTSILQELRPPILAQKGLTGALQEYARQWSDRIGVATGFRTSNVGSLPLDVEEALFRVSQEALANVARHSQASEVKVELVQEAEEICLLIQDNGKGFEVIKAADKGQGLLNMRERVEAHQGRLSIFSTAGGTLLRACIPLVADESACV